MSIIGVGIDIVEVSRFERIIYVFKNKLAQRILSDNEWNEYIFSKNNAHFLAKKFAAKEAASKALGTGINNGIHFNQLEFYNNKAGKPKLRFLKNALQKSKKMNCNFIHVSISDQKLYACAVIILES